MNLRSLDEKIDLYQDEAIALQVALDYYLLALVHLSGKRPVPLLEALSIKPVSRVHSRLQSMVKSWPLPRRGKPLKTRGLRLEFDELLQLNSIFVAGKLCQAAPDQAVPLRQACGKINQKALNLSPLFAL
jgi:hypothetical protein